MIGAAPERHPAWPGLVRARRARSRRPQSLASGAGTNLRAAVPNVINAPDLVAKNDGNNVSIDRESRLLSETALRFNLASSLLRGQIQLVRSAIKEGRTG